MIGDFSDCLFISLSFFSSKVDEKKVKNSMVIFLVRDPKFTCGGGDSDCISSVKFLLI